MASMDASYPIAALAERRASLIKLARETADRIVDLSCALPADLRPVATAAAAALEDLEVDPVLSPESVYALRSELEDLVETHESLARQRGVVPADTLVLRRAIHDLDHVDDLIIGFADYCLALEQAAQIWDGIRSRVASQTWVIDPIEEELGARH